MPSPQATPTVGGRSLKILENLRVFLPSRDEQDSIVTAVEKERGALGEADRRFQEVLRDAEQRMFGGLPLPPQDEAFESEGEASEDKDA